MAFKEWFQKLRPVQLYIMLVLTGVFFMAELIISHFTHSLTLLVDSYHMLCNMITLTGCVIALKKLHFQDLEKQTRCRDKAADSNKESSEVSFNWEASLHFLEQFLPKQGMLRRCPYLLHSHLYVIIDILVMLIGCIFLGSLCFSVLVEAVQTLIHIDHHDEMHFPLVVLVVAATGLLLNGFCYSLIGGYTFHQGSYLHVTENGEVILEKTVTIDSLRKGQRRLSSQTRRAAEPSSSAYAPTQRQGFREMMRDIVGCIFVILCGLVVYFTTGLRCAKYLDPVISIASAVSLLTLSYPYMKESGLILLQTIPDDINIESLRQQLLQAFPDVVNVHDLHVWQLTADKIFSTAHIILVNPADYLRISNEMTEFFKEQGITQVTIQAEFVNPDETPDRNSETFRESSSTPCLMQCMTEECRKRHCCVRDEETPLKDIKIEGPSNVVQMQEGAAASTVAGIGEAASKQSFNVVSQQS